VVSVRDRGRQAGRVRERAAADDESGGPTAHWIGGFVTATQACG
jgi:hypothetical protein